MCSCYFFCSSIFVPYLVLITGHSNLTYSGRYLLRKTSLIPTVCLCFLKFVILWFCVQYFHNFPECLFWRVWKIKLFTCASILSCFFYKINVCTQYLSVMLYAMVFKYITGMCASNFVSTRTQDFFLPLPLVPSAI